MKKNLIVMCSLVEADLHTLSSSYIWQMRSAKVYELSLVSVFTVRGTASPLKKTQ